MFIFIFHWTYICKYGPEGKPHTVSRILCKMIGHAICDRLESPDLTRVMDVLPSDYLTEVFCIWLLSLVECSELTIGCRCVKPTLSTNHKIWNGSQLICRARSAENEPVQCHNGYVQHRQTAGTTTSSSKVFVTSQTLVLITDVSLMTTVVSILCRAGEDRAAWLVTAVCGSRESAPQQILLFVTGNNRRPFLGTTGLNSLTQTLVGKRKKARLNTCISILTHIVAYNCIIFICRWLCFKKVIDYHTLRHWFLQMKFVFVEIIVPLSMKDSLVVDFYYYLFIINFLSNKVYFIFHYQHTNHFSLSLFYFINFALKHVFHN